MELPPEGPENGEAATEPGEEETAAAEEEEAAPAAATEREEAEAGTAAEAPPPSEAAVEKDEAEELRELLVRLKADFSNYQKRVEREFQAARKSGQAGVLLRFLTLLDVVERTEREADKYADFASLREAVSIAGKEAERFARDSGLEKIPTVGEPFDPTVHEALMVVESKDQPEDHVLEEVRPGYIFDGRVLRHAQVVVAKRPKEEE